MLGLSQRDLTCKSGVKQPLLSAIESGRRRPTAAVETALRQHIQVRPSVALASRRDDVIELLKRHRSKAGFIFGSTARGEDTVGSDLDIMVEFEPEADITDLLALEEDLQVLLTIPVDVISATSSSRFAASVRGEAVPI